MHIRAFLFFIPIFSWYFYTISQHWQKPGKCAPSIIKLLIPLISRCFRTGWWTQQCRNVKDGLSGHTKNLQRPPFTADEGPTRNLCTHAGRCVWSRLFSALLMYCRHIHLYVYVELICMCVCTHSLFFDWKIELWRSNIMHEMVVAQCER